MPLFPTVVQKYKKKCRIFIETGTYLGDGVQTALDAGFEKIISFEVDEKLCQKARQRFQNNKAVNIVHGSSAELLFNYIQPINEQIFFWLDAHYSGGETSYKDTYCPVLNELKQIQKHSIHFHTILIDDLRLFGIQSEGKIISFFDVTEEKIIQQLQAIQPHYQLAYADGHVKNDILVACAEKISTVAVVFSKNRAMQLEACLHSMHDKVSGDMVIKVLYRCDSTNHQKQYDTIYKKYPYVQFIKETNFRENVMQMIHGHCFVLWCVDYTVFSNRCSVSMWENVLDKLTGVIGISLRLGTNTTKCRNTSMPNMIGINNNEIVLFDWTTSNGDFGYPLELSSSIYRVSDMNAFLPLLSFILPNSMETSMYKNKHWFLEHAKRPILACYIISRAVCVSVNIVQTEFKGSLDSKVYQSINSLMDQFDSGFRVQTNYFYQKKAQSCHIDIKLPLVRES